MNNLVSAVDAFHTLWFPLKSGHHLKINLRQQYEETYTSLWRSLLMTGKIDEALIAAEQGLAQTLRSWRGTWETCQVPKRK